MALATSACCCRSSFIFFSGRVLVPLFIFLLFLLPQTRNTVHIAIRLGVESYLLCCCLYVYSSVCNTAVSLSFVCDAFWRGRRVQMRGIRGSRHRRSTRSIPCSALEVSSHAVKSLLLLRPRVGAAMRVAMPLLRRTWRGVDLRDRSRTRHRRSHLAA